jgi:hypothetical protein
LLHGLGKKWDARELRDDAKANDVNMEIRTAVENIITDYLGISAIGDISQEMKPLIDRIDYDFLRLRCTTTSLADHLDIDMIDHQMN